MTPHHNQSGSAWIPYDDEEFALAIAAGRLAADLKDPLGQFVFARQFGERHERPRTNMADDF